MKRVDFSINTIDFQKRELRKHLKEKAVNLSTSYRCGADRAICQGVTLLGGYQDAKCVFCYVSRNDEIDTFPILEDILKREIRLVVPKCISKGIMIACEIQDLNQLQKGKFGIYEPIAQNEIFPGSIEVAIVPCLSASKDGRRLGYGGGYYDRYLAGSSFLKIVLCYEKMISEKIPTNIHDCKMDMLITEREVLDFTNANKLE